MTNRNALDLLDAIEYVAQLQQAIKVSPCREKSRIISELIAMIVEQIDTQPYHRAAGGTRPHL